MGSGNHAGNLGQRAISLTAIKNALVEDRDLMPDAVSLADQNDPGPLIDNIVGGSFDLEQLLCGCANFREVFFDQTRRCGSMFAMSWE